MKTATLRPLLLILALIATLLSGRVHAQTTAAPIEIKDIPTETQRGPGSERYSPPTPAKSALPTLWLIGDSTVRNGSKGDNGPEGQWGWGAPITAFFDLNKINVVNRALGGTSSRSFYKDLWKNVKPLIKKGDFVMIQFGANDHGGARGKGALNGIAEETEMNNEETVHTFGWYLRQYVKETQEQGGTPIICSLTPHKGWSEDGKFKAGDSHAAWAEQTAKQMNTLFVPLNTLIARRYETLGKEKVDTLYVPSPKEGLHTGWDGAVVNAECAVAGLKALPGNPLGTFLSERAETVSAASGAQMMP